MKMRISKTLVDRSLVALRDGGRHGEERVLLWLAKPSMDVIEIAELLVPEQEATSDYFSIPRAAIATLCTYLGTTGYFVPCQVHSHPAAAFHSAADDRWALVRHAGALSLVVPHFALRTSVDTFVRDAAAFELDPGDRWLEVDLSGRLELIG